MAQNKQKSPVLLAFTTTAIALPGISVNASTVPEKTSLSYRFSNYQEDDVAADKVLFGDVQRYDIDVHQFNLLTSLSEKVSMNINASSESMSGASPWGAGLNAEEQPYLIMSGATIEEDRQDIIVTTRYHWDDQSIAINLGRSDENDYESISGGIDGEWELNNKLTTLNVSISFSSDDINPTDATLFGRTEEESKHSSSFYFGASQVINKSSVIQAGVSYTRLSGYLTDPYKLSDKRPQQRNQWAWSVRYRKYLTAAEAALHVNYRYYRDSWGTDSHTFKLAYHQNFANSVQLIPSVRYYSQSAADFFNYAPDFTNPDADFSNDYRLSAYGAITLGLKLLYNITDDFKLIVSANNYNSGSDKSHDDPAVEHPALVDFNSYTVGFDYSF